MYETFVAIGDSFTEGLDDRRPDGTHRGWADLVAGELAADTPGFRYANLAVRGRRFQRIRNEQLPLVEAMTPSLVTVSAGGNDIIGFRCDVAGLARAMHELLERLTDAAGTVVVFTGFDPRGRLPMGRVLATRAADYNAAVRSSANLLGSRVVDLWTMPRLSESRMWAGDRLHLSTDGHELIAEEVLDVLGVTPLRGNSVRHELVARSWLADRRSDGQWARTYFAPWLGRKLRGRSAGDFVDPKLPELTAISAVPRPRTTDDFRPTVGRRTDGRTSRPSSRRTDGRTSRPSSTRTDSANADAEG
jgi:lysophospholipase L1-like esterase